MNEINEEKLQKVVVPVCTRKKRKRSSGIIFSASSRKRVKLQQQLITTPHECCFCHEGENKHLGIFFVNKERSIAVHQFCMFFSAGLPQKGQDNEGFDGFLIPDIIKEANRASRIMCKICNTFGANAGCSKKSCRVFFHINCGMKCGFQFKFVDPFDCYCLLHRSHQNLSFLDKTHTTCPICLDDVDQSGMDVLKAPCCKNVVIHKSCVQLQADTSGYFFRCPTCNNKEEFTEEMSCYGVFVPMRDAAWECGNAFSDLLEEYKKCDVAVCKCQHGRRYCTLSGKWNIIRCYLCGQSGVHIYCLGRCYIPGIGYVCNDCNSVTKLAKKSIQLKRKNMESRLIEHKRLLDELKARDDRVLLASSIYANPIFLRRHNILPCSVPIQLLDIENFTFKWNSKRILQYPYFKQMPKGFVLPGKLGKSKVPQKKCSKPLNKSLTVKEKTQTPQNKKMRAQKPNVVSLKKENIETPKAAETLTIKSNLRPSRPRRRTIQKNQIQQKLSRRYVRTNETWDADDPNVPVDDEARSNSLSSIKLGKYTRILEVKDKQTSESASRPVESVPDNILKEIHPQNLCKEILDAPFACRTTLSTLTVKPNILDVNLTFKQKSLMFEENQMSLLVSQLRDEFITKINDKKLENSKEVSVIPLGHCYVPSLNLNCNSSHMQQQQQKEQDAKCTTDSDEVAVGTSEPEDKVVNNFCSYVNCYVFSLAGEQILGDLKEDDINVVLKYVRDLETKTSEFHIRENLCNSLEGMHIIIIFEKSHGAKTFFPLSESSKDNISNVEVKENNKVISYDLKTGICDQPNRCSIYLGYDEFCVKSPIFIEKKSDVINLRRKTIIKSERSIYFERPAFRGHEKCRNFLNGHLLNRHYIHPGEWLQVKLDRYIANNMPMEILWF